MIFEVTPEHIGALSDVDLRTLVGDLAEREIVRAGHSPVSVTYGGHQNSKDGGVDVRIDLKNGAIDGYIPRAQTGFQVKAEDMSVGAIQQEMCPGGKLRPAIINLGEAGGAYVIVSSKGSVSDTSLSRRRNAMANALADVPSASGLHVDFYDRRRIATWVNQHPGLIPWVRSRVGQLLTGWRPFEDWSSSPAASDQEYLTDDNVRLIGARLKESDGLKAVDGLNKLRAILSQPKGVVRLVGLSGVGKTRLVQALFDSKLGSEALSPHLAIYTDIAEGPDPVPVELLSRLQSFGQPCFLIVDNCGIDLHRKLTTRINAGTSPISLITIEYDISDDEPENTDVFKLEPASSDVIEKIIKRRHSNLTAPEIRTIAAFSEGNFRVALALADTAEDGVSLASLQDSDLFKRLFRQKNEDNPALLRAAKVCSLVYSFDGETLEGEAAELPILAALAEQSSSELHGYVAELYRRQLVQKRAQWRAVLPHALAHRLAKQALQDIPLDHLRKSFINAAPERLLKSFSRRLGCLHESQEARTLVTEWLGVGGLISDIGNLNALGMAIFDNVAPVNPDAALNSIQVASERREDFFEVNQNSAELLGLLRSLAYDAASFDQALALIAQFVRFKTESNDMRDGINVFKSLFFIFLSGTHASARQRTAFLRELAEGDRSGSRQLVLVALDAMLECGHFSSSYSFEFGTRRRDYGFQPRTWADHSDWYRSALSLGMELSALPGFRDDIRSMIASQFRFLVRAVPIDDLIAVAVTFARDGGWPQGWTGVRGALRDVREAKRNDETVKLQALEEKLRPGSLSDRIASYVLPPRWGALDVVDVDLGNETLYATAERQATTICEGIGAELAKDLAALAGHLPEMLLSQSTRVLTVAGAIGRATDDPLRAWEIICKEVLAPVNRGKIFNFPGYYLWGLSENNRELVESLLDEVLASESMSAYLVPMQVSVGLNTRGCERLIRATKLPNVPTHLFRYLAHGRATDPLSGEDLKRLLLAIANCEDGVLAAIDILHMRVFSLTSDKKQLGQAEKEIGRVFLTKVIFERDARKDMYHLSEVVKTCLVAPDDNGVVKQLCERLREAINQWKVSAWDFGELVTELAALFPRIVLEVLVERKDSEDRGRQSVFEDFSERRACPLRKIDDAFLLDWAHEKPGSRFVRLAEVITPWKDAKGDRAPEVSDDEARSLNWTEAAKRLMHEAPEPLAVLQRFRNRFHPSAWGGSLADILTSRLPLLERLRNDPDQRIAKWATQAIPLLQEEIKWEREGEAKEHRMQDERFE